MSKKYFFQVLGWVCSEIVSKELFATQANKGDSGEFEHLLLICLES